MQALWSLGERHYPYLLYLPLVRLVQALLRVETHTSPFTESLLSDMFVCIEQTV